MIKGVFFDLDGVLVDSETYDQQITADCIREYGFKTDPRVFRVWIGASPQFDAWSVIRSRMHPDDDPVFFEKTIEEYHREKRGQIYFPPLAFPDAVKEIRSLKDRGYKMACCSASEPWYIERALQQLGIRDCFEVVISGRDIERAKPDPQIYLLALDALKLEKEEVIIIEDSTFGIKAGRNSGIKTIARVDHNFGMDQSEADAFIDTLDEIENYL